VSIVAGSSPVWLAEERNEMFLFSIGFIFGLFVGAILFAILIGKAN